MADVHDGSADTHLFPRRAKPTRNGTQNRAERGGGKTTGDLTADSSRPAGDAPLDGAPTVHDGMPTGRDGAPTVHDGMPTGRDGAPTVHDGMPSARDGAATARLPLPAPLAAEGARLPDGEPTAQLVRPLAPQRADGPPPDPPAWDGGDALDDAPSAEPWPVRRAVRRRGFSVDGFRAAMVWLRRVIVFTLVAVLLSPLLVAFRVWYVARQDSTPRSDAVIVLGAAQYNGTPSPVFQWRLKHAARLYREKVAPVIVTVGGGQPGDRYTEAASGRRWLAEHGVPASKIVAVGEGADTQQSLVAVGREFRRRDWTSAVLVSDPWHALRARTMARDQGITAETSPTRSGPIVQTRGTQARYIIRETGGYLQYVLEGSG